LNHGHGPAFIFLVLDHARRPAIAYPQARFLDRGVIVLLGCFIGKSGKSVLMAVLVMEGRG